ncbi:hypothetical protein [Amphritea sp.]|uniref:hypothetical protein n=1 Tax=Amphritea sp. TaxID=1872502 RepID=UPI003D117285
MKNYCFIIRCIDVGEAEINIFNTLKTRIPEKSIFYLIDQDQDDLQNHLSLPKFRREKKLQIDDRRLGWKCGDYCFYRVYDEHPDYDYYWLIESDVYIDNESLNKLIIESDDNNSDLMIHNFGPRTEKWDWHGIYKNHYPKQEIYGGLFPLVRLTGSAIKDLYRERLELIKKGNIDNKNMPNDESFVCSFLANNGYKCSDIKITKNGDFNLTRKHISHIKKGGIYHPVFSDYDSIFEKESLKLTAAVSDGSFAEVSYKILQRNNFNESLYEKIVGKLFNGNKIDKLRDLANSNMMESLDFSLSAFELAKNFRPGGQMLIRRSDELRTKLGLTNSVGLTPILSKKIDKKSTKLASYKDFNLGVRSLTKLQEINFHRFKPFSYEDSRLYLVDTDESAYKAPFLYSEQRDNAIILCDIPTQSISGKINQEKITFIFSIGRCGSTLVSKLLSSIGFFDISECDVFTQTGDKDVINTSVYIFQNFNPTNNRKISFKFRSQTNRFIEDYISNFKDANYIFLYRNKSDWAKSYSGKFNWKEGELTYTYTTGYNCLKKLKSSIKNLQIINYDKLIKDPKLISSKPEDLTSIKETMSKDSQQGIIDNSNKEFNKTEVSKFLSNCKLDINDLV